MELARLEYSLIGHDQGTSLRIEGIGLALRQAARDLQTNPRCAITRRSDACHRRPAR